MAKVAIKVRLKQDIIDWIAREAKKRGIGWHPCLDQILDEAKKPAQNVTKEFVKSLIREELKKKEKKK